MANFTKGDAVRYAESVVNVLASDFPDVKDGYLRRAVQNDVTKQALVPSNWFELIVTYTREWRLHPIGAGPEPWRVELVCHKSRVTDADVRFSDSVNARLRAIRLEG